MPPVRQIDTMLVVTERGRPIAGVKDRSNSRVLISFDSVQNDPNLFNFSTTVLIQLPGA